MQENERYRNKRMAMYRNEGDSSSLERPSLRRLRKAVLNRDVDVVCVAHLYFLASNPEHLALLYQEMRAYDVELFSIGEGPFDETIQGQLLNEKSKSDVVASLVEKGKREQVGSQSPMDRRIDGYLVNWIQAYQGIIITPNYLLSPQIACIRVPLWRVAHLASEGKEIFAVLANPSGLFPIHREALESIATQFS